MARLAAPLLTPGMSIPQLLVHVHHLNARLLAEPSHARCAAAASALPEAVLPVVFKLVTSGASCAARCGVSQVSGRPNLS